MPRSRIPRGLTEARYHDAAQEYLRYLREHRPEHFMEATPSATQRKITLESFDLIHARRPEVQVFNELLVQYPGEGRKILRIVPDNMVVVYPEPLGDLLSFNTPTQDAHPFWVFEYVSKDSTRKDYEESYDKYEQALRVPYYLIFYPETQDLSLFRLNTRHRYLSVKPSANGRYPIPKLEMEIALLDGWVRYWYQGELLPLPAEMLRALDQTRSQLEQERARANAEQAARQAAEEEIARLRALLQQQTGKSPGNGSSSPGP